MDIKEILSRWQDYEFSSERHFMQKGVDYFNCKNDITLPENGRYETSLNPQNLDVVKPAKMSDRRISHNFFKFIINQQVAYGIARRFVLTTSAIEELESKTIFDKIRSKIFKSSKPSKEKFEAFNILVSKTFEKKYDKFINCCINAPKTGIGWLYVYYNDYGELDFLNMNPVELLPIWGDEEEKQYLEEMLRKYKVLEYSPTGDKQWVTYIEEYGYETIKRYRYTPEINNAEPELIEERAYFSGGDTHFPFIPFIPIKYNGDLTSLLQDIKELIDGYDKVQSEIVDNIVDIPNSLTFVSGFDGTNQEEVDAFVRNVKIHRFMFAPEGADAKGITAEQNIEQMELTLTRLRKDIFEIGGGVDTQNKDLKDTSGVALRWSYSNIEEKFNIWALQLEKAIRQIIDLILWDNEERGGVDFSDVDYDIIFNTDSIINERETVEILQLSKGMISPETIAINHPYTKDAEKELKGMREELEFEANLGSDNSTSDNTVSDHNTNEQISGSQS